MPQRIRLSRVKGWRIPDNTVNVARAGPHPGKLGNLFIVGRHGTRAECAAKFWQLAHGFISVSEDIDPDAQAQLHQRLHAMLPDLAGQDVACWCALDGGACHGDVILALANPGLPLPKWMTDGVTLKRVRIGMHIDDYLVLKAKAEAKRSAASTPTVTPDLIRGPASSEPSP